MDRAAPARKSPPLWPALLFLVVVGAAGTAVWMKIKANRVEASAAALRGHQDSLRKFENTFEDAYRLAASTSRIALSGPVSKLQALHREAEAMQLPACMAQPKADLVESLRLYTSAFMGFMANRGGDVETLTSERFAEAGAKLGAYQKAAFSAGICAREVMGGDLK